MYSTLAAPSHPVLPQLKRRAAPQETLHADSRCVGPGDIFVACRGEYADGRDYIPQAVENGAGFVYWDADGGFCWQPEWQVPNQPVAGLRERAGILAAEAYGNLAGGLNVWGVTGTNGKTSITQWLAQAVDILEGRAHACAVVGTVGNGYWGSLQAATHTTPDPVSLQTLLRRFRTEGATHAALEVSSHGLDQYRVNGVPFTTAVFTNLTRDHLDYHGGMDAYGAVKTRLFHWHGLRHAVINSDDPFGAGLSGSLKTNPALHTYTYGFNPQADIRIVRFQAAFGGMTVALDTPWGSGEVQTCLLGRFNAQNLAACVGVLCANGYGFQAALNALARIRPATGRMDCIARAGRPLVVIDYAHTPDALEKALSTLREILPAGGRLWCVFGCGGNRDRGKRPLMGAAAAEGADCVVITSDNPRMEHPADIIADILPAVPAPALVEPDRARAIRAAVTQAAADDIVLIAGKGHEDYQDANGEKRRFSDFEEAERALEQDPPAV